LIQVTEDVAAGGRKCLKFVKVAGLTYSWQPHLCRSSRPHTAGEVRFACDVMNSPADPAEFSLSLRDYSAGGDAYRDGPVVVFQADGAVVVAGKTLMTVPLGAWAHVEILVHLGDPAAAPAGPRTYRLAITLPGRPPQVFDMLACARAEFAEITWFGFSMGPQPGGVYYVDNLLLERTVNPTPDYSRVESSSTTENTEDTEKQRLLETHGVWSCSLESTPQFPTSMRFLCALCVLCGDQSKPKSKVTNLKSRKAKV
jgi:hypothetical protein